MKKKIKIVDKMWIAVGDLSIRQVSNNYAVCKEGRNKEGEKVYVNLSNHGSLKHALKALMRTLSESKANSIRELIDEYNSVLDKVDEAAGAVAASLEKKRAAPAPVAKPADEHPGGLF